MSSFPRQREKLENEFDVSRGGKRFLQREKSLHPAGPNGHAASPN
jgi:hypothetical protein